MPLPSFQQYDTLKNRSYGGFLVAEFLAAFNDQCIHASAMFFAMRKQALSENVAITLMPVLFYAPWALFCTLSGYFADRLSKRTSLIFWKVAEVGITLLALLGFWLGAHYHNWIGIAGAWIVMGCVFLMGTHSAFYVPAKYGFLPEVFTPRMLSRANGIVESTTFLAVILGTTVGGVLSFLFKGSEYWIGIILVILAAIGAVTSFMIRRIPPADPNRPFPGLLPWNLYRPLVTNLKALFKSRLSVVAIVGLASFTFLVAFMRATMYHYGESQNPRWDEFYTSMMVGVVTLGVGLSSPLAGYLAFGKVELGMAPLGSLGMAVALVVCSALIHIVPGMVAGLIVIGLCSGFYLVPLYTTLQYSAPKGSKGASVATSNFLCVLGAMLASGVMFLLLQGAKLAGIAVPLRPSDVAVGQLSEVQMVRGRPVLVVIRTEPSGAILRLEAYPKGKRPVEEPLPSILDPLGTVEYLDFDPQDNILLLDDDVVLQSWVKVSKHTIIERQTQKQLDHYHVRLAHKPLPEHYDSQEVPRYLFLTAGTIMLIILLTLRLRLPDFFLRSAVWLHKAFRRRQQVLGIERLSADSLILATDCRTFEDFLRVQGALIRPAQFIVTEDPAAPAKAFPLTRYLAKGAGVLFLPTTADAAALNRVREAAVQSLQQGELVVLSAVTSPGLLSDLLRQARQTGMGKVLPVRCGVYGDEPGRTGVPGPIWVGEPLGVDADTAQVQAAVERLGAAAPAS